MRSLQVVRAGLAALVVVAMAVPAGPAYGDSGYDRYRKLRVQSRLYQNLGRPVRAAEALVEAYEAFPDESMLLDAVAIFREAEAPERALRTAERYLTVSRSAPGRRAAEEHIQALRQQLSQNAAEIEFVGDPPGTEICLVGADDSCRVTPFIAWVPAGERHLRAHYPGLPERVHPLTVEPGKHVRVSVTLREHVPQGRVDVFARTAQAEITIDGRPTGKAPLTAHALTAGSHVVSVNLGEGDVWQGEIVVEPGRTTTIYAGRAPPAVPVSAPVTAAPPRAEQPPPLQVAERVIPMPQLARPLPDHIVAAVEPAPPEPVEVAPNDVEEPLPTVVVARRDDSPPPLHFDNPVAAPIPQPPLGAAPPAVDPAPLAVEPTPNPMVTEPDPVVVEPDPAIVAPEPAVAEPDPVVVEPDPVVAPDPAVVEPDPVVADPDPIEEPVFTDPNPPVTITDSTPANWKVITGWTGVGVGAAALGGAIATSVLALQAADQATALRPRSSSADAAAYNRLGSEAKNMAMVSNILYPVGGALVAAGVTLLVLDLMTEPDEPGAVEAVGFGATPVQGGVMFGTTFEF